MKTAHAGIQKYLCLDLPDLLILEVAALNHWSTDQESYLKFTLDYCKRYQQPLSAGELAKRISRLVGVGYLQSSNLRWVCSSAIAADVAAHACLQGRLQYITARQRQPSYHFYYSPFADQQELLSLFTGALKLEKTRQLVDTMRSPASLAALPESHRTQALLVDLPDLVWTLSPAGARLAYLESLHAKGSLGPEALAVLAEVWLLQGRCKEVESLSHDGLICSAYQHFYAQEYQEAHRLLGRVATRSHSRLSRLLFCLTHLRLNVPIDTTLRGGLTGDSRLWLGWLIEVRSGIFAVRPEDWSSLRGTLGLLLVGAASLWENDELLQQQLLEPLAQGAIQARQAGYQVLAGLFESMSAGQGPLANLLSPVEGWQRTLDAITELCGDQEDETRLERMAWIVESAGHTLRIEAKVQKRGKNGWSPGRSLGMTGSAPFRLGKQDSVALARVRSQENLEAFAALVGHPHVYYRGQNVEIVVGQPELKVQRVGQSFHVTLCPAHYRGGLAVETDGPNRFKVIRLNAHLERMAAVLGPAGLAVPQRAEEKVQRMLTGLSTQLSISSDISLDSSIEEREADPRLYVRLSPHQAGLQVQAMTRPFGEDGPACPAGEGAATLVIRLQGRTLQTVRNLAQERMALNEVNLTGSGPWIFPDPFSCLELLERLQQLDGQGFQLEWPQGQPFKIKKRVSSSNFSMVVESQSDWFEVSGQLQLDHGEILKIEELIEKLRNSSGRFIALGDGEFLALSEEFRHRLQQMADVLETGRGKKMRLHPLAAGMLEDMPGLKADQSQGWRRGAQPYRSRLCHSHGPVEPGRGRSSLRPHPPHRPAPTRDGLPSGRQGHR
ncbi:hypothetical protein IV102_00500 [bacterium]|nr:hypothetical protein [bacterium]